MILGTADEQVGVDRSFLWMSTNDEDWKGRGPLPDRGVHFLFDNFILYSFYYVMIDNVGLISWPYGYENNE